jgi:hypothetical protein
MPAKPNAPRTTMRWPSASPQTNEGDGQQISSTEQGNARRVQPTHKGHLLNQPGSNRIAALLGSGLSAAAAEQSSSRSGVRRRRPPAQFRRAVGYVAVGRRWVGPRGKTARGFARVGLYCGVHIRPTLQINLFRFSLKREMMLANNNNFVLYSSWMVHRCRRV